MYTICKLENKSTHNYQIFTVGERNSRKICKIFIRVNKSTGKPSPLEQISKINLVKVYYSSAPRRLLLGKIVIYLMESQFAKNILKFI